MICALKFAIPFYNIPWLYSTPALNKLLSEISGELKLMLSMVTGLEPREQRLLFRGKEREDTDHLHMVGVRDKDKVLLLEDPALKDMKLQALAAKSCRARASLLSKCSPPGPALF